MLRWTGLICGSISPLENFLHANLKPKIYIVSDFLQGTVLQSSNFCGDESHAASSDQRRGFGALFQKFRFAITIPHGSCDVPIVNGPWASLARVMKRAAVSSRKLTFQSHLCERIEKFCLLETRSASSTLEKRVILERLLETSLWRDAPVGPSSRYSGRRSCH